MFNKISEENEIKERFGKLGMFLIQKAQDEIKEITRKSLFQKAEIRKNSIERANENSLRLKNQFIETYSQTLNSSLSKNILEFKKKILELKNACIEALKKLIIEQIKDRIKKNYSKYIDFLINKINNNYSKVENSNNTILLFNSKDYDYFKKNLDKLKNKLNNSFEIRKSSDDFIGGYILLLSEGLISYDFTLDTFINNNNPLIQKEFSNKISDKEIKELGSDFDNFIQNKKQNINVYLDDYDRF